MKKAQLFCEISLIAATIISASNDDIYLDPQMYIEASGPGLMTQGTRVMIEGKDVLISQIPDTITANGYACQMDSAYPFEADIADDIDNTTDADWTIDSITTWWANWNGFTTWANVPNVRVILYADNSGMPADSPYVEVQVEAAYFVTTTIATDKYALYMDMSSYDFTIPAGSWWFEIQPSNVFTVNGQTGWQCEAGIGNGQELYYRSQLLGVPNWTSATTQWGQALEPGIIMYGTVGSGLIPVTWDFETGAQDWTVTSTAGFPAAWAVMPADYKASYVIPSSGDSSMWIDSDAAGSGTYVLDTAMSPVFVSVGGDYLKWGYSYNNISSDRLKMIYRLYTGGSWQAWVEAVVYSVDNAGAWDSLDVSSLSYDSMQVGFVYDDNNSWAWYAAFDNVGPVLMPGSLPHDVKPSAFLSPNINILPGTYDIIGVVNNIGGYEETYNVKCIMTSHVLGTVLESTIQVTTGVGEADTINFGPVNFPYTDCDYNLMIVTKLGSDGHPDNDTLNQVTTCVDCAPLVWWLDVESIVGNDRILGCELIGAHYLVLSYSNSASYDSFAVIDLYDSTIAGLFQQNTTDTWGYRDLCKDGGDTIYGSFDTNVYGWVLDTCAWVMTQVNSYMGMESPNRALAYIPGSDTFYSGNFSNNVSWFDKAGNTGAGPVGYGFYGAAYDLAAGKLWYHGQVANLLDWDCTWYEFDPVSKTYTGEVLFCPPPSGYWGTAGGACYAHDFLNLGYDCLVGVAQGTPSDFVYAIPVRFYSDGGFTAESPDDQTVRMISSNLVDHQTDIQFSLADNVSHLDFLIYDVTGRIVYVKEINQISPGVHSISWNQTDFQGIQVSSGIYFFRLDTGKNSIVGKFLIAE
ncbi:MAG: FlgD immunoglobulin-like domain containing protein [bacterium]